MEGVVGIRKCIWMTCLGTSVGGVVYTVIPSHMYLRCSKCMCVFVYAVSLNVFALDGIPNDFHCDRHYSHYRCEI